MRPSADTPGTFTLFVYGTLKRGGCRHAPLASQRFLGEARTEPLYRLYDLGSYPGRVHAEGGDVVHGELYEVSHSLVPSLDSLEGAPDWFDLAPVEIVGRAGPVWAYYTMDATAGRPAVKGGRWEPERDT
jgi:gamma-glutamylcyclotransferase (GGCT)/AIG2-like uncharacterized protein YtfP